MNYENGNKIFVERRFLSSEENSNFTPKCEVISHQIVNLEKSQFWELRSPIEMAPAICKAHSCKF